MEKLKFAAFFIAVLMFASLVLIGCTNQQKTSNPAQAIQPKPNYTAQAQQTQINLTNSTYDCKTGTDCFYLKAYNCAKAKAEVSISLDIFGMNSTATTYMETRGMENGKCLLYRRNIMNSVKFSDKFIKTLLAANQTIDSIKAMEAKANKTAAITEGLDSTCRYQLDEFNKLLGEWKNGSFSFSTEDKTTYECTGSMYDPQILNERMSAIK